MPPFRKVLLTLHKILKIIMRIKNVIIAVITITILTTVSATAQKVKMVSREDSLSYALGVANFKYYQADSIQINTKLFSKGMTDASKNKALMTDTTASSYIVGYMGNREKERLQAQYKVQIEAGKKFLSENGREAGVVTLPSGLQYKAMTTGNGPLPGPEDVVSVHYTGKTIDGTKFDSSYDRGEPASFRVSNVIRGWVEGLQLMPVGSKYMLYIPSDLAYGERGAGSIIKPFETLIFEVELLDVIKE
jgi:FKBP-type peptidyl-prolyl cis-trans isomerase